MPNSDSIVPRADVSPPTFACSPAHARWSGDRRDRAALIEEFVPLARSLAWRFRTSRASHEDLVQVACLGLVKAVDRFDPQRG